MKRKRSRFDRLMLPTLAVGAMVAGFGTGEAKGVLISITTAGVPVVENFNSLANTGISNSALPTGWEISESGGGSRDNELYAAGTGSDNTGDTYSFGAAASTERALGGLQSGTLVPTIGVGFVNNTGAAIDSLGISYVGEMWRAGVTNRNAADRLDFQFSTNATSITTGTFADIDSLDFSSPNISTTVGLRDGNAVANQTLVAGTINGLNIANGSTFFIRWNDFNIASSDDGLAIDDFSITANGAPPPPPPPPPAEGAVLPGTGSSLTFDFNTFTGSGFTPTPAAGQLDTDIFIVTGFSDGSLAYGGSGNSGDFARGTSLGGETTGGIYAFEVSPGNFALGVQPSDPDFSPGTIELRLQNLTGTVIDLLDVDFEVLVLNNEGRSSAFAFSYSTNGTTFIDVPSALVSSVTAAAQPPVWTSNPFSLTLASLGLADGSFLFLRWTGNDLGGSGSRDEFALDNIVITNPSAVIAVPEPVTFSLLIIGGVALMGRRQRVA